MQFGGRYLFDAPRPAVWDALNNTAILKAAIPGCRSIEWRGAQTLNIEVEVNLGVMRPVLGGDLELSNVNPAESYTLSGRGRGPLLGMAHAAADVVLSDTAGGTELSFVARGRADGPIARLGRKLIGNSAQGLIDGFFERIGAAMGARVTPRGP